MKKITTILLLTSLCFCSPKTITINDLDWLIATRSTEQNGQIIYESWSKIN